MSTPANLTTLSRLAKGLFQEGANEVAEFLCPPVVTGAAQFFINDYAKDSAFDVPNARRAIGGKSKAVLTDGDRVQVTLYPNALHDIIDSHELDLAATSEGQSLLRQARTRNLISQCQNARLKNVIDTAESLTETPFSAVASADVFDLLDEKIESIANKGGGMPDRLLISLSTWRVLRSHPSVLKRLPGAEKASLNPEGFASFLLNPNLLIKVSDVIFNQGKLSSTKSQAIGSMYLFRASQGANMFDNAFMKNFRVKDNAFQAMRVIQEEHGEKLLVDWTEAPFINNPNAGMRLKVSS